jgi:hypothetical protein
VSKETYCSVKRDLIVSTETYYGVRARAEKMARVFTSVKRDPVSVKRDLLQWQKRPRDLRYCQKRLAVKMTSVFTSVKRDPVSVKRDPVSVKRDLLYCQKRPGVHAFSSLHVALALKK